MRVVTAGGATIELGTVETMPTIGITDYSRRVTDDFGVTTVVPRGFARTMQVKLAVPFEAADDLQRQLAALRTSPARWIADDRFACLAVQGFFKDFSIDMAVPPLSYCTLTIEGLVENEALPDNGGDPAPDGRSTMQLLAPIAITDAGLVASSVSETDYAAWSNSLSYGKGARVILAATHRIYESAVDGNAGNDPAGISGKWLDVGPTNRWAMFDQALGSSTSAQGSIAVTITAAAIRAIALLDVVGATVRVQTASYDRTIPVSAGALTFLDLPPATTRATVTITGAGTVSVGTLLAGKVVGLGITEASPTAGITDYSRKVVDDFGAVTVVPRAWAKKMDGKTLVSTSAIDAVFTRLAAVRATPALWIGHEGIDSLTIYGFVREFSLQVGETLSNLSLSIEGLSTAGKVQPFAPGGGSVAWPDITDPDGTKPKPNADKTSENTAKDTAAIGGKPAAQVIGDIASVAARALKLETETIPAINKAVGDAADRISAAQYAADQAGKRAEGAFTEIADRVAEIDERFDTISQTGGYDDTAVKASIEQVRRVGVGNTDAIAELATEIETSVGDLDAAIKTTARTAASDTKAVSERLDSFIAQGGGGSDGVDTLARSEIQRVERAYIEADKGFAESILDVSARLDITPVSFRLVSRGAYTPLAAGQPDAGVYNAAGQLISGSLRGWNVVVWNAQNQVAQSKTFDTLGGLYDGGAQAMADFLNALPGSTTVTIHTADEPATNHSLQALIDAIARCGGGAAFTSQGWAYRGAYVLVGRTGIGRGNGVEIYRGTPAGSEGATDAYISHSFSLLKGVPQASGNGSVIEATAKDLTRAFTEADQALSTRQTELVASASAAASTLNPNPDFSSWSNPAGLPDLWEHWGAVGPIGRIPNPLNRGGYAIDHTPSDISSGLWRPSIFVGNGWYVMTATVWKTRGTWNGAGVTLNGQANIDFMGDPDTGGRIGDSNGDGGVRTWTKVFEVRDDYIGSGYKNWHLLGNWDAFGRGFSDKTLRWLHCGIRPANDAEVRAMKADAALNNPGGVLARLTTHDNAFASLPDQYAAASRAADLEAQVNGEGASRLLARAGEQATAIADGKLGSVTKSVSDLRSEYNGTASIVSRQAGTIVDLQDKAVAYVKYIADAGSGVASLSLWSDQFGGAWELTGNGRIRGNLLVDGEITTTKIAPNQITLPLGAQTVAVKQILWSNADPQYGVEVAIPLTTGAPVRLDFRYSTAGGGQGTQPPLTVQIQRVNGDGSTVNFSDASYIGGIILDYPPAGQRVTYRFYFKHQYAGSGSGVSNIIYQQLFALELKR